MRKTLWVALLATSSLSSLIVAALAVWFSLNYEPVIHLPEKGSAQSFAHYAIALTQRERYPEAKQANLQALSYQPDNASLHYNQGWIEAHLGDQTAALKSFQKTLSLDPNHVGALVNLSWLQKHLKDPDFARSLNEIERLGIQGRTPLEQVRLLQLKGKHVQALEILDQLRKKETKNYSLYYWQSISYQALGKRDAALTELSNYLEHSRDLSAYRARAQLYQNQGKFQSALSDLQACLEIRPGPELELEIAEVYLHIDPIQSLAIAQKIEKTHPKESLKLTIEALLAQRAYKVAQAKIEERLNQDPQNELLWALQGKLLRQRRKYDAAQDALKKARKLGYNPAELDVEQARIAAQQGDREKALKWLQSAFAQQPDLQHALQRDRLLRRWL